MLRFCKGFLRSTRTAIALAIISFVILAATIAGEFFPVQYDWKTPLALPQEINSWLVSARLAFSHVYNLFVSFVGSLLAGVLIMRVADRRMLRAHFRIFKPVAEVDPEKDLVIQNYKDYYLSRGEADQKIQSIMAEGRCPLVLGLPSMGKTRTAWEAARRIEGAYLLVPELKEPSLGDIPFGSLRKMAVVLLLDDLNKWAAVPRVDSLISRLRENARRFHCIATCRTGEEYQLVEKTNASLLRHFREVKLPELSDDEGERLCQGVGEKWEEKRNTFDRTPGCILLDLSEMRRRYEHLRLPEAKTFLRAVKLLYLCGIYQYRLKLVRGVMERIFALSMDSEKEVSIFSSLVVDTSLLAGRGDPVQIYDPYLEQCVSDYPPNPTALAEHREKLFDMLVQARDPAGLFYMGVWAYDAAEREFAERCYAESLGINPDAESAHNNYANLLAELGRRGEAEEHYKEALRVKPDFAVAHDNYANLLVELRRREEAEEHYREALSLNPDLAEAHYNYAILLGELARSRWDEAEEHYREALRVKPDFAEAHNNYANLLDDLGRRDEAEEHYREALRVKPDFAVAHDNYAILLVKLRRREEAEKHYREALRLNPDYAKAHNNYANLLKQLDRREEAEGHYSESLRLNPDFAEAHNNYANLLGHLGRKMEAEEHYRQALRLNPDYAEAHYNYSILLGELARNEEAEQHLREAYRLMPALKPPQEGKAPAS